MQPEEEREAIVVRVARGGEGEKYEEIDPRKVHILPVQMPHAQRLVRGEKTWELRANGGAKPPGTWVEIRRYRCRKERARGRSEA